MGGRRGREAVHWKQRVCSDVSQQTCEDGHMELPGRRISGQRIAISGVHEGSSRSLCVGDPYCCQGLGKHLPPLQKLSRFGDGLLLSLCSRTLK